MLPWRPSMENPYQPPASSTTTEVLVPKFESAAEAASAGERVAIRWVNRIVVPILVLAFLAILAFAVYAALDDLPYEDQPLMSVFAFAFVLSLATIAVYLVACFWAGLFTTIIFVFQHRLQSRSK